MTAETQDGAAVLDSQSVADYLRQHPDFFSQHDGLLADIELDHNCGQATSLIERQIQVMRHKIQDNAGKMADILSTARRNDVQFEKTKRLVIELAAATQHNGLTEALKQSFTGEFHADAVHLALFSPLIADDNHPNLTSVEANNPFYDEITALAAKNWAYCQAFKGDGLVSLFDTQNELKSCAIVPLYLRSKALGVLIIASNAPDHYNEQLDTLFLNHVAAVTARCLGRIQA